MGAAARLQQQGAAWASFFLVNFSVQFECQESAGQLLEGQDIFGPRRCWPVPAPAMPAAPSCHSLDGQPAVRQAQRQPQRRRRGMRWSEKVLWQFFSSMDYYERRLPCDATKIGRIRRDLGEDGMEQCSRPPSTRRSRSFPLGSPLTHH